MSSSFQLLHGQTWGEEKRRVNGASAGTPPQEGSSQPTSTDRPSPPAQDVSLQTPRDTWGQGLLQLLGLLLVRDDQGVQVPAAAHLELHIVLVLLDLDRCGIKEQVSGDSTPTPPLSPEP